MKSGGCSAHHQLFADLLARQGAVVPQRTVHRYELEVLGPGQATGRGTVPVIGCEPGAECQVDSGKMGPIRRPVGGAPPWPVWRPTDPADLPHHTTVYAMRDVGYLQRQAEAAGSAIDAYAAAIPDDPLPWTNMRQVCALPGQTCR